MSGNCVASSNLYPCLTQGFPRTFERTAISRSGKNASQENRPLEILLTEKRFFRRPQKTLIRPKKQGDILVMPSHTKRPNTTALHARSTTKCVAMTSPQSINRVSVVIPVYQGATSLPTLMEELEPWTRVSHTRGNHSMQICEVVLVHDCGPDRSHKVIQELEKQYRWVCGIWLSRNYGQHAATLAGMASSIGDWVVTMDEDLQQNPADIGGLLDAAISGRCQLVYASPVNPPPHGFLRNSLSALAKTIGSWIGEDGHSVRFNSFRLVEGEIARNLAAYCGRGIYLDIALSWVTSRVGSAPVLLRAELNRRSGYSIRTLTAHFSECYSPQDPDL